MKRKSQLAGGGQGLVEYALLLALIAIGVVLILQLFGISVRDVYCDAAAALGGGEACAEQERCVDDFVGDGGEWNNRWGKWEVKDDQMCTSHGALSFNGCTMNDGSSNKDYTIKLDGATLKRGNGYGVFFRTTKPDKRFNGYTFQYDPGYAGGAFIFRKWVHGRELRPFAVTSARGYDWYNTPRDIEIVVKGNTFTAYIDGEAVLTGTDDTYSEGGVGLRSWDGTQVCFDRFAIGSAH